MRSSVPIPGNLWSHDMVITVEDNPHALVDLLWIREAWNLQPAGNDHPPLLSDESVKTHARTEASDRIKTWQSGMMNLSSHHFAESQRIHEETHGIRQR